MYAAILEPHQLDVHDDVSESGTYTAGVDWPEGPDEPEPDTDDGDEGEQEDRECGRRYGPLVCIRDVGHPVGGCVYGWPAGVAAPGVRPR